MTVQPASDYQNVGLEDIGAGDLAVPRLRIDHDKMAFVNTETNQEYTSLDVVLLGLVKGRVFFDRELQDEDKSAPICKSNDNELGFPNVLGTKAAYPFPFEDAGFQRDTVIKGTDGDETVLPCEHCALAKWGADSKPPPCAELWSFPLMYREDDGTPTPAIFTVKGTGIKPAKTYTGGFGRSRKPLFTALTRLTLMEAKKGRNTYGVPQFTKVSDTDPNAWGEWAEDYRDIRDFLRQPPRTFAGASAAVTAAPVTPSAPVDNSWSAPQAAVSEPVEAEVVEPGQMSDDPWASQSTSQAAPTSDPWSAAPATPTPQATPAATAPTAAPVAPTAAPGRVQPTAAPAAPPAAPATPPAAPSAAPQAAAGQPARPRLPF